MPFNHYFWNRISQQQSNPRKQTLSETYLNIIEASSPLGKSLLEIGAVLRKFFPGKVKIANKTSKVFAERHPHIRVTAQDQESADRYTGLSVAELNNIINGSGYVCVKRSDPYKDKVDDDQQPTVKGRTAESLSSTFYTYTLARIDPQTNQPDLTNIYKLVIGKGKFGNKGNQDEDQMLASLKSATSLEANKLPNNEIIQLFKDKFNIELRKVDSRQGSTKRPFTGECENYGSVIADMIGKDIEGEDVYISFKNINGVTILNSGATGLFYYIDTKKPTFGYNPNISKNAVGTMLTNLNFNVDLALDRLNKTGAAYMGKIEGNQTPFRREIIPGSAQYLKQMVQAACSYGYYYLRDLKKDGIQLESLMTPQDVLDFIGEPLSDGYISYPYFETSTKSKKHFDIELWTRGKNDKIKQFIFQIRTASGGFEPDQLNLMLAYPKSTKSIQLNTVESVLWAC